MTITVTTTHFLPRRDRPARIRATGPAGTVWTEQSSTFGGTVSAVAHHEALANYLALHQQHEATVVDATPKPGGNGYAFTLDVTTGVQP